MSIDNPSDDFTFEEMVAYVFGELTLEREQEVENLIASTPIYGDAIDGLLTYCEGHAITDPETLKQEFMLNTGLALQLDKVPKTVRLPRRRIYALSIAASILVLVLAIWSWQRTPAWKNATVAQEWYLESSPDFQERTMGLSMPETTETKYALHLRTLEKKDATALSAASKYFANIPVGDSMYHVSQAYLGYAYFIDQQYAAAIIAFDRYLAAPHQRAFGYQVDYHRCLALLGTGRISEAKDQLLKISKNPAHDFAIIARRKLDKFPLSD